MDTLVAPQHELTMTRRIPAPPRQVFDAWVNADRVKAWFGPCGMTVPDAEVEARAGGFHRTLLRDAAGREYPNRMEIAAIEPPRLLVFRIATHDRAALVGATGTLAFHPEGDGTRLDVRWSHPTAGMRAAHEEMGFFKGWAETLDRLTAHVLAAAAGCPGAAPPAPEHGWLHRLLGEWRYETACVGPDGQAMQAAGIERVRSLGGYWVVGESEGGMPGGGAARWIISLGYDPAAKLFRGSFVGSMMAHMFIYEGRLAEDGASLALDTTGPAMDGNGTALYRDTVTLESEDARLLSSAVKAPDGSWTTFMTSRFTRLG